MLKEKLRKDNHTFNKQNFEKEKVDRASKYLQSVTIGEVNPK